MLNKKGKVAVEELRGILTFVVVAIIFIIFFYGCNLNATQKTHEMFEFSKNEIEVIKDLNFFLETPNEEKKVSDLIIESYLNNDYSEFDEIVKEHFDSDKNRLLVLDKKDRTLYDSLDKETIIVGELIAQNVVKLPIAKSSEEIEFIGVMLRVYE